MTKTPKLENLESDLDKIFEYTYVPKLVRRELMSFIVKHRINELEPVRAKKNALDNYYTVRDDGTRDVSSNERQAQLWDINKRINESEL